MSWVSIAARSARTSGATRNASAYRTKSEREEELSRSPDEAELPSSPPGDLRRFLLGVGSWFGSFGLHGVLFSTLLVVELRESEVAVGAAQSALLLPSVALMLVGGAVADHGDRRRLLIRLHGAASLLAVVLATALLAGWLSYPLLLAYAVAMGSLQAFVNPARDALLSEVASGDFSRPVALVNLTQWGSQASGALLGAASRFFGAAPLLFAQAAMLSIGLAAFAHRGRKSAVRSVSRPSLALSQLTGGIREVLRTGDLLATWVLVCGVGVLFIGPFMVVFPLMVRDVFGGGAPEIALVSASFPVGTITGSLIVMKWGELGDRLRAQWISLSTASLTLLVMSVGLSFPLVLLGVYAWGISGAVFMIAGRTLFQERASESNRGRVLATYSMGFMGAAGLFGAPLSGYLAGRLGPDGALAVLGSSMLALVATVMAVYRRRPPTSSGALR